MNNTLTIKNNFIKNNSINNGSVECFREWRNSRNYFQWIINLGIILFIILFFWYVILLNSLATRGFQLEELKEVKIGLQKNIEKLDIALTIPTSIYALRSNEQVQEMNNIKNIDFIYLNNGNFAYNFDKKNNF